MAKVRDRDAFRVMCRLAEERGLDVDELAARIGLPKHWRNGYEMRVCAAALRRIHSALGVHPISVSRIFLSRANGEPVAKLLQRWCQVFCGGRTFLQEVAARGGSEFIASRALRAGALPDPRHGARHAMTRRVMLSILSELADHGLDIQLKDPAEDCDDGSLADRMRLAELSCAEIGRRLGVTRQAVQQAVKRGRGRLFRKVEAVVNDALAAERENSRANS